MIVVTLARRPLSEVNVATNVLKHGCGAVNVDASRISAGEDHARNCNRAAVESHWRLNDSPRMAVEASPKGRWPANLVLQHLAGCSLHGERKVKAAAPASGPTLWEGSTSKSRGRFNGVAASAYHGDADGMETVAVWDCTPGCPVANLDMQTGFLHASGNKADVTSGKADDYAASSYHVSYKGRAARDLQDKGGGASRFFKQFGGTTMTETTDTAGMPADLIDYLRALITPTQIEGGETLMVPNIAAVDWASIPDERYHGLIARGEPTPEQTAHIWRVVKPGAHVLLVAPDTCPTGHRGACSLEDKGFEIRDSILWVNKAGGLHYVPKANTKERNAGCEAIAAKRKGPPVYELKEESLADEEAMTALQEALTAAGVSDEVIDAIEENGLPKDLVPDDHRSMFKKRPDSGKYGNFHPCLHPDALVMTPVGHRRISTLMVGDLVYSADGEFHPVTDVSHHQYTSPDLYEIRVFGTNLTTLASDNHPFLVWRPTRTKKGNVTGGAVQWVEARDVRKGDYTMTPLPADQPISLLEYPDLKGYADDENFWFLFGLYLAEGVAQTSGNGGWHVYPSYSLHVEETDLIGRIRSFFEPRVKVSVYPKGESLGVQVMAFDPVVGALFVELCGKGATSKVLHPMIWNIDRKHLRAIFEGHTAGDGGKVRTYWQSKTSSEALSAQLRMVGDALGFRSNHHRYKAKSGGIGGRKFKHTSDENHLRFFSTNQENTHRAPSRPLHLEHDGVRYALSYVKEPVKVPYAGEVWNLSVKGSPTFQTAVGMSHNTVKPKEVLARLLSDVPKDAKVLDPFMGSGSMGLACLETGHDYTGIEKEGDYLEISDSRVRHWAQARAGWVPVTIESEAPKAPELTVEAEEGSIFDMFGG